MNKIVENINRVIIGKEKEIIFSIIALLCKGHLLINDVPGVGKTMLAKSLGISIGGNYKRIQFTSDLLPSDIIGVNIFDQKTSKFEFKAGPIFSNVILADEINRAPPKTQSALLESMEERKVTVDGVTHNLSEPFFIIATQNPIEYEGTYPLPEAQLDRFFLQIGIGYLKKEEEIRLCDDQKERHPIETLKPVVDLKDVVKLQEEITRIHIDHSLKEYIVEIVGKTRTHSDVFLGASARGSLSLYRAAKAYAGLEGRDYVVPDDIKALAMSVLGHRIILKPEARIKNITPRDIILSILEKTPVPTL